MPRDSPPLTATTTVVPVVECTIHRPQLLANKSMLKTKLSTHGRSASNAQLVASPMLSHTTTIRMLILVVSIVIAKHVPLACLVSERIVTNVLSVANSSSDSRAVCECDRKLVNFLFDSAAANSNYNANDCEIGKFIKSLSRIWF